MTIEAATPTKERAAWLKVTPQWIAGLWGLRVTGQIRIASGGELLVEFVIPPGALIQAGDVVAGMTQVVHVPTGLGSATLAPAPSGRGDS